MEFKPDTDLLKKLEEWVADHEDPNLPVFKCICGKEISPSQALEEIRKGTDLGKNFYNAFVDIYTLMNKPKP